MIIKRYSIVKMGLWTLCKFEYMKKRKDFVVFGFIVWNKVMNSDTVSLIHAFLECITST